MIQIQPVNRNDVLRDKIDYAFNMIDNYIYLYHTDSLFVLPVHPETVQDSMGSTFAENQIMSRSAPIYSFSNSGPRSIQLEIPLHRDMLNDVNIDTTTMFKSRLDELSEYDYVDRMIKGLQSAALPRYASSDKMINPPMVAVRFGKSIFCKGVVDGGVTATHSGPILRNGLYAMVTLTFTIKEVDPYDADTVAIEGGFRGLRTTLESRLFRRGSHNGNYRGFSNYGGGGGSQSRVTQTLR